MYTPHGGKKFGGAKGGKKFGGNKPWERSGGRDGGRSPMFAATCSSCGDTCQLPFKPNGSRPVFCSKCFNKEDKGGAVASRGGRDDRRPSFGGDDRQMFKTECDACGNPCEVPFRPTGEREVFCRACFGKETAPANKGFDPNKEQFKMVHSKLDAIMKLLTTISNNQAPGKIVAAEIDKDVEEIDHIVKELEETPRIEVPKKVKKEKATKKKKV